MLVHKIMQQYKIIGIIYHRVHASRRSFKQAFKLTRKFAISSRTVVENEYGAEVGVNRTQILRVATVVHRAVLTEVPEERSVQK